MPEHIYERADLIERFDRILGRTLEEIDDKGLFQQVRAFGRQKGVVGTLIEQCVLGYAPDSRQEADLVVLEEAERTKTELKSTGMVIDREPTPHFVAKEPMSITAVGIYDLPEQRFETSHFWNKLEHMLLVYYHYDSDRPVEPYEYRRFPVRGYEFHIFSPEEREALRQDWEHVRALAACILSHHPGPRDRAWREAVKREYIEVHGELRPKLSFIDLAPRFPPRFRLKKAVVSSIIMRHFGYRLEQLPGRYTVISDVDRKCRELTARYAGKTVEELAAGLGVPLAGAAGRESKHICERIAVAMFGGRSARLDQIEMFQKFGIVAKSITVTPEGGRTEDMKLFRIDFLEMVQREAVDEEGAVRPFQFEDSALYDYFAGHDLLCIRFQEPPRERVTDPATGRRALQSCPLSRNTFLGFKRLTFSEAFIQGPVRRLWEDTREKVLEGTLVDVPRRRRDGSPVTIGSGEVSSAPNFLKSSENPVFIRGSGTDSSLRHKTEKVNGIRMLPQYVWLRGSAVVAELGGVPDL